MVAAASADLSFDMQEMIELLEGVEQLANDAVGTLVVEQAGGTSGAIFVEHNQICWVAAKGMGPRLSALLCAQAGRNLTPELLDEVMAHCKATGEQLGDVLLARGILHEEGLARAMRRHTAESLIALSHGTPDTKWTARQQSFAARHYFAPATLLTEIGAISRWAGHAPSLVWLKECGARGAAYSRSQGTGNSGTRVQPVAEFEIANMGARAMYELGCTAAASVEAVRASDPRLPCALFIDEQGNRCVGWARGVFLLVAVCDDDIAFSRVVGRVYGAAE